jgi:hypothetical protein
MPKGHYVHRDYASVTNMPGENSTRGMDKGSLVGFEEGNEARRVRRQVKPTILTQIIYFLWALFKTFKAGPKRRPAMLARGSPMNPAGGANEGGGKETSQTGRRPVDR